MEKVESTLEEIQNTQSTLAGIMKKIQNHIMQDADQEETSVDETPDISEPLPPLVGTFGEVLLTSFGMSPTISETILVTTGPSREKMIFNQPSARMFEEDFEEQLR